MNSDWSYAIDMCAASGILNYDAAADILGQKPRFVGNPKMSEIEGISPVYLPEGTKMKDPLSEDGFEKLEENDDKNLVQNPTWKKVLIGGITALGIGAGLFALFKGKLKMPKFSKINFDSIKNSVVNVGKKAWGYIKKPFVYIMNLIKKKP